ncbi:MAG: cytochrome c [Candidatus Hydrogenedentota bacterium]
MKFILGIAFTSFAAFTTSSGAIADVSYTRDIAPLFHKKCAECHRPGQVAPMSLLTYQETRPWAKSIREKVFKKDMPPWFAIGEMHQFKGDPRLTQEEIDMVVSWVDKGAPKGNPKDMPTVPQFHEGWKLGEPDMILELDNISIEQGATDRLTEIPVPFEIDSDQFVTAVEFLPEPSDIVHHIILYVKDDRQRRTGIFNWLAGWGPGMQPMVMPEGSGRLLKDSAEITANIHVTPREEGGSTKIKIGLHFAQKGEKMVESVNHWTMNPRFKIPAGDSNYFASAEWTAPFDATVTGLIPHMHLRGKDMKFTAKYLDGTEEVLLDSIWNNDWQVGYYPVEPYNFPKGTKILVTGHFDNSPENPSNPDPAKDIRWGNRVTDEMFIGYIDYMPQAQAATDSD